MKKYLWRYETLAVTVIGVFCVVFLIQTYHYGRKAALFPRLVSSMVLFLILFFILSRLRRILQKGVLSSPEELVRTKGTAEAGQPHGLKWTFTFGLAMVFFLLMYLIGFGPATVCYLVMHTRLAGYRRFMVIFLFALAVGGSMVFIGNLFHIPLPEGIVVDLMIRYWQNL